jgi:hypothetical protein
MRASVVRRGLRYVFFGTKHGGVRKLTGYYRLGWYCEGPLSGQVKDYALAAEQIRFVHPAVPFKDLPAITRDVLNRRFRGFVLINEEQTLALLSVLNNMGDATPLYLEEVDRLERFNQHYTGYRCWNRTKPFTWEDAEALLQAPRVAPEAERILNQTPTDRWTCLRCASVIENKALLKQCPACGAVGSLRPSLEEGKG